MKTIIFIALLMVCSLFIGTMAIASGLELKCPADMLLLSALGVSLLVATVTRRRIDEA